jgi:hypothetical protein
VHIVKITEANLANRANRLSPLAVSGFVFQPELKPKQGRPTARR